jgi:hypothetical protein
MHLNLILAGILTLISHRSSPLQIALCCYFIYEELGAAIFSGVAVMVLTIPINTVVAKMSRKYQLDQMKNKDKRTKLMNEIIGGVKVLKLYGKNGFGFISNYSFKTTFCLKI